VRLGVIATTAGRKALTPMGDSSVKRIFTGRLVLEDLAHRGARGRGREHLDDRRIAEVELGQAPGASSGPETATCGASAAWRARSRTSKVHIGPPTSTTAVMPSARYARSRSSMPARLRARSSA